MSPILIIAIVIAVVVVVGVVLKMRAGEDPGTSREAPKPSPKPTAKPTPKPEPKKAEPKKAEPKAGAKKAESEDEPEQPTLEPDDLHSEPAPPPPPTTSSPEDIAALRKGLKGTRGGFISRLAKLFGKKKELAPEVLDEMEEVLITADLGVSTADAILKGLRAAVEDGSISDGDQAWEAVKGHAREILTRHGGGRIQLGAKKPTVILVVGVNGVGKTTTIGKLASRFKDEGKEVLLAAGDTFRAAAVLQLEVWGRRTKCAVVKGKDRADPGSVVFDAIKKAQEDGVDVVIADTAGRLHTKSPLMDELKKVGRTIEKALDRPADQVLLVLDATTGQNAIQQAELFSEALPVNGIALTKLDGTAKGGVILGICDQHELPVRYVGIGERVEDLREFEANGFVEALFERPSEENAEA